MESARKNGGNRSSDRIVMAHQSIERCARPDTEKLVKPTPGPCTIVRNTEEEKYEGIHRAPALRVRTS
jgi:hypothetical protein